MKFKLNVILATLALWNASAFAATVIGNGVNLGTGATYTPGVPTQPGQQGNLPDVVIGNGASSSGSLAYPTLDGSPGYIDGGPNVALGANATTTNTHQSVAIGSATSANGVQATAIGSGASASGGGAVAIGVGSVSSGSGSVGIGYAANVSSTNSVAIGNCVNMVCGQDPNTGAAILTPIANGDASVSIGNGSSTTTQYGVALGTNAQVTNANSVALGAGSATDRDNSVAIGNRQITGVAAGTAGTDGVNVDQLNQGLASTLNQANSYTNTQVAGAITQANNYTNQAVNASNVFAVNADGKVLVNTAAGSAGAKTTGAQGMDFTAADGQASNITGINNLTVSGTTTTKNLAVQAGGNVDMGGNQVHGVAAGTADTDAVNVGQLNSGMSTTLTQANTYTDNKVNGVLIQANSYTDQKVNAASVFAVSADGKVMVNTAEGSAGARTKGDQGMDFTAADGKASNVTGINNLTVEGTTSTQNLTIGKGGNVNMGGNQVHGVAAGTADTDAVNVSQLNAGVKTAVTTANAYTDTAVNAASVFTVSGDGKVMINTTAGSAGARTVGAQGVDFTAADGQASNVSGINNLTVSGTTSTQNLTVGKGGKVDMGGNQVHGVAAGTAGTDAVNVDQLNAVNTSLGNQITDIDNKVKQNRKIAAAGAATAMAMNTETVQQHPGEFATGVGIGHYDGSTALAVSSSYLTKSGKTKLSAGVGGGSGGKMGVKAGVSFAW